MLALETLVKGGCSEYIGSGTLLAVATGRSRECVRWAAI